MDKQASKSMLPLIGALAIVKLAIHLVTNAFGGYGFFRDELYYIACSNHIAPGYVDQPPLPYICFLSAARSLVIPCSRSGCSRPWPGP